MQLKDDLIDEVFDRVVVGPADEHAPVVGVALGGGLVPDHGPMAQLQHHLHRLTWSRDSTGLIQG